MKKADAKPDIAAVSKPSCRCEATIPSVLLDGYACGNPGCWRTPIVQASFDGFVADLVRERGTSASSTPETANDH